MQARPDAAQDASDNPSVFDAELSPITIAGCIQHRGEPCDPGRRPGTAAFEDSREKSAVEHTDLSAVRFARPPETLGKLAELCLKDFGDQLCWNQFCNVHHKPREDSRRRSSRKARDASMSV